MDSVNNSEPTKKLDAVSYQNKPSKPIGLLGTNESIVLPNLEIENDIADIQSENQESKQLVSGIFLPSTLKQKKNRTKRPLKNLNKSTFTSPRSSVISEDFMEEIAKKKLLSGSELLSSSSNKVPEVLNDSLVLSCRAINIDYSAVSVKAKVFTSQPDKLIKEQKVNSDQE